MTLTPEKHKEDAESKDVFMKSLESTGRIVLAGFGGALVGLSLARRQASHFKRHSRPVVTRGRRYTNQESSRRWAVSCIAFATVFEGSRLMSPCNFFEFSSPYNKQFQIIGDYSISGAIAGLALRGIPIETLGMGSKQTPRVGAGMAAGLILGFIPGVIIAGLTFLEDMLQLDDSADIEKRQQDDALSAENSKV
mmetsp:Transcript_13780/g.21008  ORF Transcript_13780/g.21008 Transcript_13780/m.21008 type:complete len:194 (-) Transcript_13780:26-607(-)